MDDLRLVKINIARRALTEARSVADVKDIRDKAAAMQHYLRQHEGSLEAQNYAAELKLRAERRLGELLKETVKQGRPSEEKRVHDETFLPDGVSRQSAIVTG